MHGSSTNARPLKPLGGPEHYAWATEPAACPAGALGGCAALALFNAGEVPGQVAVRLDTLNLTKASAAGSDVRLCGRNLWSRKALVGTPVLDVFAPKARCDACVSASARGCLLTWHCAACRCRRMARRCMCFGARRTAPQATTCSRLFLLTAAAEGYQTILRTDR